MKRIKIEFLTLVGLIAMSFSIYENGELFKKTLAETTKCFRDISVKNQCTDPVVRYIECSSACPGQPNGLVNQHVFAINSSITPYNLISGGKPSQCGPGTIDFCCATIDQDDAPCMDQTNIDPDGTGPLSNQKWKVVRVFCKTCL